MVSLFASRPCQRTTPPLTAMTNIASPRSLVLLCYLHLIVFAATSVSAFAIPAASSTLSVQTLLRSFHPGQVAGAATTENPDERRKWGQVTVTELYVLQTTVATKTITTFTAVRKTTTTLQTTVSYPTSFPTPDIPIVTYYTTVTITAPRHRHRRRRRRRREAAKRQFPDFDLEIDPTTTRTVLTRKRVTATKTVYSTTLTIVATVTREITVIPKPITGSSSSGLWTQVSWATTTVTVQPGPPSGTGNGKAGSVKKGAVAGGVVGAVAVVAGLLGFCFFRRKRSMQKFDERSNRRSESVLSDTGYRSIPGAPSSGSGQEQPSSSSSQQRGELGVPESERLMSGPDAIAQAPGYHYRVGEGSGAGAYDGSPLLPPNQIPGTPIVIPPSSTTSLRTDPSPRGSANPASSPAVGIGITLPTTPQVGRSRHEAYARLSPRDAASPERRPPPSRRRVGSLSANIVPPPLKEYQGSRTESEASTAGRTLANERTTASGASSFYSETETVGSAMAGDGQHGEGELKHSWYRQS